MYTEVDLVRAFPAQFDLLCRGGVAVRERIGAAGLQDTHLRCTRVSSQKLEQTSGRSDES